MSLSNSDPGKITLITSQMFGGKTSYLMHILETMGYATRSLYINHSLDSRDKIYSTHNNTLSSELSSTINADMIKVANLSDVPNDYIKNYKVVCIDEAQFFSDLVSCVTRWSEQLGTEIYVAGLSGDYQRNNFGKIHELLPLVDDIILLRDTLCSICAKDGHRSVALFTKRIVDNSGNQIEIGSKNYLPVCRKCYIS